MLRVCGEIGGRARLGLEGFCHVEEPTLQVEAADALVANMVRHAVVHTGGVGLASTELAPDLTALDFV